MAKTEKQIKEELKKKMKAFELKKQERIEKIRKALEDAEKAEYKKKPSKVKLLNATEFKTKLATIATKSADAKKRKKWSITDVAEWTDAIEPTLMSIIATAKQAKEKALENMDSPKDKRQFRRLIDKVERTGLRAKDFLPAIKAQQNRIANLSEDLADITKYLTK